MRAILIASNYREHDVAVELRGNLHRWPFQINVGHDYM
jgi:hypothetical protein